MSQDGSGAIPSPRYGSMRSPQIGQIGNSINDLTYVTITEPTKLRIEKE